MQKYLLQRLLILVPTWIMVGLVAFVVIHLTPGDPAAILLAPDQTEGIEVIRERLGLDRPMIVQMGSWISGIVLRGDLGQSFFLGRPVADAILERIPVTLSLASLAFLIAVSIGVPLGVLAALRPNTWQDTSTMTISLLGLSVPDFVMGLVLIFVFAVNLQWLPVGGFVPLSEGFIPWLRHLIMPAFAIGFTQAALIARITRSSMLEVLTSDYVRTARSKGVSERSVVWLHAFRNAIISVVTILGLVVAVLLSGSFITEIVFRLPGVGNLLISAVRRRDYPIVQGGMLVVASTVLIINLAVDMLYAFIDPRIKYDA